MKWDLRGVILNRKKGGEGARGGLFFLGEKCL